MTHLTHSDNININYSLSWNCPEKKEHSCKNLHPMFKYCSAIWTELNVEESINLSNDLLKILKKYSKLFKITEEKF